MIYLQVLPIFLFFLLLFLYGLKRKQHLCTIIFSFLFIGHGIGIYFFIMYKHLFYEGPGNFTIHNFSYSAQEFYHLYFIPIIFSFVYFLTTLINVNNIHQARIQTSLFIKKYKINRWDNYNIFLLFILYFIIMFFINIFMYQNQVGIVGLPNSRLPFKLSGILYYSRIILISIGLFVFGLYLNKKILFWIFSIFLISLTGICASSRSLPIMGTLSLILLTIYNRKFFYCYLLGIFVILIFQLSTHSRDETYRMNNIGQKSIVNNIVWIKNNFRLQEISKEMLSSVFYLTYRIGGPHDLILSNQANFKKFEAFEIVSNIFSFSQILGGGNHTIFKLLHKKLNSNFAFGISIPPFAMLNIADIYSFRLLLAIFMFLLFILYISNYLIDLFFYKMNSQIKIVPKFFIGFYFFSTSVLNIVQILFLCFAVYSFLLLLSKYKIIIPVSIMRK